MKKYNITVNLQDTDELAMLVVSLVRMDVEFSVAHAGSGEYVSPTQVEELARLTAEAKPSRLKRRINDGRQGTDVVIDAIKARGPLSFPQMVLVIERAKFAASSMNGIMSRLKKRNLVLRKADGKYHLADGSTPAPRRGRGVTAITKALEAGPKYFGDLMPVYKEAGLKANGLGAALSKMRARGLIRHSNAGAWELGAT